MTLWILLVLGLWVVQTFLPTTMFYLTSDAAARGQYIHEHVRGRDNLPPDPVYTARAKRALNNLSEALPVFLGLALLHELHGDVPGTATLGAAVFFGARVLYVPAYLSAVPMVRSIIWTGGVAGLLMMAGPLVTG